jgi:hypothetical protein
MGLFDTLQVNDPLPSTPEMEEYGITRPYSLQTKDLESAMDHYVLENGILYLQKWENQNWVEGDPNAESWGDRHGYMKRENLYLDPVDFTGKISAYNCISPSLKEENDYMIWVEWELSFKNGLVVFTELKKFEPRDYSAEKKLLNDLLGEPAPTRLGAAWISLQVWFYKTAGWVANLGRLF